MSRITRITLALFFSLLIPIEVWSGIDECLQFWGRKREIDWRLLKAVAMVESSLRPWVIGDEGRSIGLMQVHKIHGIKWGLADPIKDLQGLDVNVMVGSAYLKECIRGYGLEGGIHAYNVGINGYRKGKRNFVYYWKVIRWHKKYQKKHPAG